MLHLVKRVLFLCAHNSARSQMAEGFLRSFAGDRFEVQSAESNNNAVNLMAFSKVPDVTAAVDRANAIARGT